MQVLRATSGKMADGQLHALATKLVNKVGHSHGKRLFWAHDGGDMITEEAILACAPALER